LVYHADTTIVGVSSWSDLHIPDHFKEAHMSRKLWCRAALRRSLPRRPVRLRVERLERRDNPDGHPGFFPMPDFGVMQHHEHEVAAAQVHEAGSPTAGSFSYDGAYSYTYDVTGGGSGPGVTYTYESHEAASFAAHVVGTYSGGIYTISSFSEVGSTSYSAQMHAVYDDGTTGDYSASGGNSWSDNDPPPPSSSPPLGMPILWPTLMSSTQAFTLDSTGTAVHDMTMTQVNWVTTQREQDQQRTKHALLHESGGDSFTDSQDGASYWGDRSFTQDTESQDTYHRHDSASPDSSGALVNSYTFDRAGQSAVHFLETDRNYATSDAGGNRTDLTVSQNNKDESVVYHEVGTDGSGGGSPSTPGSSGSGAATYTLTVTNTDHQEIDKTTSGTMTDATDGGGLTTVPISNNASDTTDDHSTYQETGHGIDGQPSSFAMDHFTLDATHTEQDANTSSWGDQSSSGNGYDTGQYTGPGTWSDQATVTLHEEGTAGNFTFTAVGSSSGDPPEEESGHTSDPSHTEGGFNLLDGLPDGSGSATAPVVPPAGSGGIGGEGWLPGWSGQGIPGALLVALAQPLPDIPDIPGIPPILKPYLQYNKAVIDAGNAAAKAAARLGLKNDIYSEASSKGNLHMVDRGGFRKDDPGDLLLKTLGINVSKQDKNTRDALLDAKWQNVQITHATYVEWVVKDPLKNPRSGEVAVIMRAVAEVTATKNGQTFKAYVHLTNAIPTTVFIENVQTADLRQGTVPVRLPDDYHPR
jgi:hypothetical protein